MLRITSPWKLVGALSLFAGAIAAPAAGAQPLVASQAAANSAQLASQNDIRLAALGYRLALSNSGRCAHPAALIGVMLHDPASYDEAERASVERRYALGRGFGILNVVPGSAADRAGLRTGDVLVRLAGSDLSGFGEALSARRGSYRRVEAFLAQLRSTLSAGSATITYRRDGEERVTTISADHGCGGEVVVMPERDLNAWSDGHYVAVTTRMMEFANSDDELAFVVAHEMAHNILGHSDEATNTMFPAGHRQSEKDQEFAADALGVAIMASAGYDVQAANHFLARTRRARWMDLAISHPGIGRRMQGVTEAIAALELPRAGSGTAVLASAAAPSPTLHIPAAEVRTIALALPIQGSMQAFAPFALPQTDSAALRPVAFNAAPTFGGRSFGSLTTSVRFAN
jgi:Zn-dependent protease with chaperone function